MSEAMDPAKLAKARRICDALTRLAAHQRGTVADRLCGGDAELRASVESLMDLARRPDSGTPSVSADGDPNRVPEPNIAGYEIVGRLGEGGMGIVWEAVQLSTRRRVALKLLSAASLGSQRRRSRFVREVELAASLEHPSIARVYESGLDKGVYYYAMELVRGVPLDEYARQRQLTPDQILALAREVCLAVQHAHERGVIHRDLKPSNILVDKQGQPHILDFGLAKLVDDDTGAALSIDGDVSGTPMFMSPEQAAGSSDQIDARTDVYTLGVIMYRLLTGTSPHDLTGSYLQVIRRVAEEEVRRPRAVDPKLDAEVEAIILKALSRQPADRYSSAGELAADIERYLAGAPISARPATLMYVGIKRLKRHRWAVLATMLLAAAIAVIATTSHRRTLADHIQTQKAADKQQAMGERERQAMEAASLAGAAAAGAEQKQREAQEALKAKQSELEQARDLALKAAEKERESAANAALAEQKQREALEAMKVKQTELDQARVSTQGDVRIPEPTPRPPATRPHAEAVAVNTVNPPIDIAPPDRTTAEASLLLARAKSRIAGKEFFPAGVVLNALRDARYSQTRFIRDAKQELSAMQHEVDAAIDKTAIQDCGDYLLYTKVTGNLWQTAVTAATEENVRRKRPNAGAVVLRVFSEDPKGDAKLEVSVAGGLGICRGGGTCAFAQLDDGKLFSISTGVDSPLVQGKVSVWPLHHMPVAMTVSLERNKVTAYGEVVLRRLPAREAGDLLVRIKAEPGMSLEGGALQIGRVCPWDIAAIDDALPLKLNGICAGQYVIGVRGPSYGGPTQRVTVKPQANTPVEVAAFSQREVEFQWWHRKLPATTWENGVGRCTTGKYWSAAGFWGDLRSQYFWLSDWSQQGCILQGFGAFVVPLPGFKSAETTIFPDADTTARSDPLGYRASIGNAFALALLPDEHQAIIRIRTFTPIQPGVRAKQSDPTTAAPLPPQSK